MNSLKKIILLLISMVLCVLLPTFVWADDPAEVEFSAEIDQPVLYVSDKPQTVVITVKTNVPVDVDGFEGKIVESLFDVTSVESGDPGIVEVITGDDGYFMSDNYESRAEIIENTTTILEITCTVPANTPAGNYPILVKFDEITHDYGEVWASVVTVTANLEIKEEVENITVESKGVAEYDSTADEGYSVEGNVVTVKYPTACKVGYLVDNSYVAIPAEENDDGSYSFTAPEGVTEVLVVVKGDVTGEGSIFANDVARMNAYVLGKTSLTAEALFAADVTGEGSIFANDVARLNAAVLGKTNLTW